LLDNFIQYFYSRKKSFSASRCGRNRQKRQKVGMP